MESEALAVAVFSQPFVSRSQLLHEKAYQRAVVKQVLADHEQFDKQSLHPISMHQMAQEKASRERILKMQHEINRITEFS